MKLFIDSGIVVITLTMMLAVGLSLDLKSFPQLLHRRKELGILLACHLVVPLLIGVALVSILQLPPSLAASLLLLAACPIGDIANVYTVHARGNAALSLSLNAATCFLAPLTMVACFAAMRWVGFEHQLLAVPATTLFSRLFLFLILPVALGAWFTGRFQAATMRIRPWLHRLTGLGILLMLVVILSNQWDAVRSDGPRFALICLVYMLACMLVGHGLQRRLALPAEDLPASFLCFPVRNVGIAGLIAITLLDRIDYASVAAIYFLVEVPLLAVFVVLFRRGSLPRNSARSFSPS